MHAARKMNLCSTPTGNIMKRTELEKASAKKISGNMKLNAIPDRFGKDAGALVDKREQRRRDQELGLIPTRSSCTAISSSR